MDLKLRPKSADDEEFLFGVFANTRSQEMAATGWGARECEAFLRQQFNAQTASYQGEFPNASYSVISLDGEDCGRLYVDRRPSEIRILDFALAPQFCGRGIGPALVEGLQGEARGAGKVVTLYVEKHHLSEIQFYERFGFMPGIETEFAVLMTWEAPRIVV